MAVIGNILSTFFYSVNTLLINYSRLARRWESASVDSLQGLWPVFLHIKLAKKRRTTRSDPYPSPEQILRPSY